MVPEVDALNQFRLEHDLTLQQISDRIGALGYRLTASTLQRMIANPDRRPIERSLYKVRKFLESVEQPLPTQTPTRQTPTRRARRNGKGRAVA
jgi:hypothetical protein